MLTVSATFWARRRALACARLFSPENNISLACFYIDPGAEAFLIKILETRRSPTKITTHSPCATFLTYTQATNDTSLFGVFFLIGGFQGNGVRGF